MCDSSACKKEEEEEEEEGEEERREKREEMPPFGGFGFGFGVGVGVIAACGGGGSGDGDKEGEEPRALFCVRICAQVMFPVPVQRCAKKKSYLSVHICILVEGLNVRVPKIYVQGLVLPSHPIRRRATLKNQKYGKKEEA